MAKYMDQVVEGDLIVAVEGKALAFPIRVASETGWTEDGFALYGQADESGKFFANYGGAEVVTIEA